MDRRQEARAGLERQVTDKVIRQQAASRFVSTRRARQRGRPPRIRAALAEKRAALGGAVGSVRWVSVVVDDEVCYRGSDSFGLLVGDEVSGVGHDEPGGVVGPWADGGGHVRNGAVAAGDSEDGHGQVPLLERLAVLAR